MAIYVLTTKIIVLNEFTQDSTSLLKAIQRFGGYSSPQQDAANPTSNPADLSTFIANSPEANQMDSRLRGFMNAADGRISDFAKYQPRGNHDQRD